jgi:purine-binding chemotaxis protein CheW
MNTDETRIIDTYLICTVGRETFGIPIARVTDIIELQEITKIPDMPGYVSGVIDLRGQVIPILDMRLRLGMEAKEYDDRTVIVVVSSNRGLSGFTVDTVSEVQDFAREEIDSPPRFHGEGFGGYLSGIGKMEERVVMLLEMGRLLGDEEELVTATASAQDLEA